jgi:hypothetical protein
MGVDQASAIEEHRVYEYQRWQPVVLWGSDFPGHFLPTDPGRSPFLRLFSVTCISSPDGAQRMEANSERPLKKWSRLSRKDGKSFHNGPQLYLW